MVSVNPVGSTSSLNLRYDALQNTSFLMKTSSPATQVSLQQLQDKFIRHSQINAEGESYLESIKLQIREIEDFESTNKNGSLSKQSRSYLENLQKTFSWTNNIQTGNLDDTNIIALTIKESHRLFLSVNRLLQSPIQSFKTLESPREPITFRSSSIQAASSTQISKRSIPVSKKIVKDGMTQTTVLTEPIPRTSMGKMFQEISTISQSEVFHLEPQSDDTPHSSSNSAVTVRESEPSNGSYTHMEEFSVDELKKKTKDEQQLVLYREDDFASEELAFQEIHDDEEALIDYIENPLSEQRESGEQKSVDLTSLRRILAAETTDKAGKDKEVYRNSEAVASHQTAVTELIPSSLFLSRTPLPNSRSQELTFGARARNKSIHDDSRLQKRAVSEVFSNEDDSDSNVPNHDVFEQLEERPSYSANTSHSHTTETLDAPSMKKARLDHHPRIQARDLNSLALKRNQQMSSDSGSQEQMDISIRTTLKRRASKFDQQLNSANERSHTGLVRHQPTQEKKIISDNVVASGFELLDLLANRTGDEEHDIKLHDAKGSFLEFFYNLPEEEKDKGLEEIWIQYEMSKDETLTLKEAEDLVLKKYIQVDSSLAGKTLPSLTATESMYALLELINRSDESGILERSDNTATTLEEDLDEMDFERVSELSLTSQEPVFENGFSQYYIQLSKEEKLQDIQTIATDYEKAKKPTLTEKQVEHIVQTKYSKQAGKGSADQRHFHMINEYRERTGLFRQKDSVQLGKLIADIAIKHNPLGEGSESSDLTLDRYFMNLSEEEQNQNVIELLFSYEKSKNPDLNERVFKLLFEDKYIKRNSLYDSKDIDAYMNILDYQKRALHVDHEYEQVWLTSDVKTSLIDVQHDHIYSSTRHEEPVECDIDFVNNDQNPTGEGDVFLDDVYAQGHMDSAIPMFEGPDFVYRQSEEDVYPEFESAYPSHEVSFKGSRRDLFSPKSSDRSLSASGSTDSEESLSSTGTDRGNNLLFKRRRKSTPNFASQ